MAMTAAQKQDAYKFFIVSFGAITGVEYMNQINDAYNAGLTTKEIVNIYSTKPQFEAIYPRFLSNEQFADKLIENVVGASATAAAKTQAKADVVAAINAGWSKGDVVFQIFTNLSNKAADDADWGKTAAMLNNKVKVAEYYTETLLVNNLDLGALGSPLQSVTNDAASVEAAKGNGSLNNGKTFTLTAGADQADTTGSFKNGGLITSDFKFTSGNETVTASAGTLAAGDVLADGSTTDADVLNATITAGGATAVSITNIETINVDVKTATGGLNMASITGAKAVNVTTSAAAQLTNVAVASAPTIGLTGSNVLTVAVDTLAGTTAAGTAETLSVKFNGATVSGANVAGLLLNATTAGALETLNIESAGSVKNTVNVALTAVQVTGVTKAVVTGAAELELRGTAAVYNNMELNASAHTGALTVRADFEGAGALVGLNAEKFSGVDGYVVTDLDGGGASADAFGLYNIATGSTVRIADDFLLGATNSIITVAGAAASTTDSVTVNLQNRAATANDVDLTGLTIGNVENITVNSTYAPTTGAAAVQQNSLGNLTAGALQNLTVKGDSNLAVTLTANSIAATNGSNITVDASAFTGNLTFAAGNIADTTATGRIVTIKGGTKDDVITGATTVAVKNVFDLSAGGKDTVNLNVGDTNDSVIAFTNGDKLALGAVAGGFVNGLNSAVINAAGQATIEAAANVGAAATAAAVAAGGLAVNNALVFSYQGTQYILMNEDTANAYDAATDAIVQVAGLTGTTTFDAGTFLFAV